MNNYLVIEFKVEPLQPTSDMLLAFLDSLGYDSFEETKTGIKAYIIEDDFNEERLEGLFLLKDPDYKIDYSVDRLENKNWNEEWETNYAPISINDQIYVRASFHPAKADYPMEIVITPKMSFGTGHHQTTRLMARLMLTLDLEGKKVLDMGTGTGVLAIIAEKRGATEVTAIDNFEWAVENTRENAEQNNCQRINAMLGDATALPGMTFDVVVANINRNVLLEDMKTYIDTLHPGATLLISGFFEDDFELLNSRATEYNAQLVNKVREDRWLACHYKIR